MSEPKKENTEKNYTVDILIQLKTNVSVQAKNEEEAEVLAKEYIHDNIHKNELTFNDKNVYATKIKVPKESDDVQDKE